MTKVYHITYYPQKETVCLHFWGCNLRCRTCIRQKEIYDCHLNGSGQSTGGQRLLPLKEVMNNLKILKVSKVIFMGWEASIDPELANLARLLHYKFRSYNTLITNGLKLPHLDHIDEVVLSIKAYTENLHRNFTGKSNKEILKNFCNLYSSGMKLRTESIFIPTYIDLSEIEKITRFVASVDKGIPYRIDAYIPVGDSPWRRPTVDEMKQAVEIAKMHLTKVSCLTGTETVRDKVMKIV